MPGSQRPITTRPLIVSGRSRAVNSMSGVADALTIQVRRVTRVRICAKQQGLLETVGA